MRLYVMMHHMDFADAVKQLRAHLNLSQEDLARELGSTLKTVYRYEHGVLPKQGQVVDTLATLATKAERPDLVEIFSERRRKEIAASIDSLQSEGSARRFPLWEVERGARALAGVQERLSELQRQLPDQPDLQQSIEVANLVVRSVWMSFNSRLNDPEEPSGGINDPLQNLEA